MKKRLVVLVAILIAGVFRVSAQDYVFGLGVRAGGIASGIDAKYNFDAVNSVEALLSLSQGVCMYGLYERHVPVIAPGFRFYYGGGAHIGTWNYDDDKDVTFGIDAIVGLEYKIKAAPFVFSVDYKPCVNITGQTGFKAADFGFIGVRYTF